MAESPPNLRFADSEQDCSSCRAFKPRSQTCAMYNDWPVSAELVCEDWQALDGAEVIGDESTDQHAAP